MGAYADLSALVNLQFKAKGFSFKSRQPVHSLLSGRRASRIRGRGLDFEEMRAYLPGDDTRTIDWKATARLGRPFVRVFTEERDRPALLAVDQRINMFFGSRRATKSVLAAETAALVAWRVLQHGDRIGGLVFDDTSVAEIAPRRSRQNVMRILELIRDRNHKLKASSTVPPGHSLLNRALDQLLRTAPHDYLIVIVSDFDGADLKTRDSLLQLASHNDVILILTLDALAHELPNDGTIVAGNGELQVEVPFGSQKIRQSLQSASSSRISNILGWQKELGTPVLALLTSEAADTQLRRQLGEIAARRSRP